MSAIVFASLPWKLEGDQGSAGVDELREGGCQVSGWPLGRNLLLGSLLSEILSLMNTCQANSFFGHIRGGTLVYGLW